MEKEPRSDEVPFGELIKTQKSGHFVDLKIAKENPNLIVKEVKQDAYRTRFYSYDETGIPPELFAAKIQNYLDIARQNFPEEYKKFIPKTQLVIGKNADGLETVFLIQENILGHNSTDVNLNPEQIKDIKDILSFLTNMYIKTFDGKTGQMPELGHNTFILGRRAGGESWVDSSFITDITPIVNYSLLDAKSAIVVSARLHLLPNDDVWEFVDKLEVLKQK